MTRDAARSAALPEAGLCCVVVTQQEGSRQRPSQSSDEGKMRDERIRHLTTNSYRASLTKRSRVTGRQRGRGCDLDGGR